MKSLKERIMTDEAVRITMLDQILFDVLGKDSLTSKELEHCEHEFQREFIAYTREIVLKHHEELTKLSKPEFKHEFNLAVDRIGHNILNTQMMNLRDSAIETGACLAMIIMKTLSYPIE